MIALSLGKDSLRMQKTRLRFFTVFATGLILVSGCAHTPEVDTVVHEAPKGSVYLERIPDRRFKASHPIVIEEGVISRALGGVMISERKTTLQTVFSKQPAAARAFSDEDVRFLAPFVTAALRQAAADQQVGFEVRNYPSGLSYSSKSGAGVGSSDPPLANSTLLETTSGHLLAQDHWLYLTVSQYRKRAEQPDTINMANRRLPDPTGEADKELIFEPKEALKPNGKAGLFGGSPDTVFVIDYGRLAQLPAFEVSIPASEKKRSPEPTSQPDVKEQDIKEIRQEMKKKDVEIENLKKEMEDIRRDLGKPSSKTP
ncbi:MAG TPA: hypothetical protein VJ746_07935 [Nitrospira sp.]|nr:hypothetical protein [Nitrospira sp.]